VTDRQRRETTTVTARQKSVTSLQRLQVHTTRETQTRCNSPYRSTFVFL